MDNLLMEIIERNRNLVRNGKVADYIPALGKANPEDIGVCVADLEGNIYKAGKYNKKFTIQSISKVIGLMLALIDNGQDRVFEKVGYEGTDEPFNTLYKLDLPHVFKPANPMINSGAIITTSLVKGNGEEKFERILALIRKIADNPSIDYNHEVYMSEKSTGHKNRAMGYMMKSMGLINGDVESILDCYFKQCSIEVDAVDLSKIGAFIANNCKGLDAYGKIDREKLTSILVGIMSTCGMYNFSSRYAVEVGIPSKSGVGGGIMGVVKSKMGIGVYGPALDENGNSSVGYGIMKDLSRELKLNLF
ncbi:glutaminase A [Wansuia hejianensis]|uniref:Glutaminase n=1 Tax=Wansuia hejianensis TaxID=2763667 RepID=A0A926EWF0_9FIRM|nr:glutaminase A [Wansuia hejianensis]MBC8589568.1 glutaminase A [Wansuia hejianensis]